MFANVFCAFSLHFRPTLPLEAVTTGRRAQETIMAAPSLREDLLWSPPLVSVGGWREKALGLFVAVLKPS